MTTTPTPRERPILFSAPMVRALVAGTKTQTRRLIKDQSIGERFCEMRPEGAYLEWLGTPCCGSGVWDVPEYSGVAKVPYGVPGDRLWVREAFRFPSSLDTLSPAAIGDKALDAGYSTPWCPTQFEADGARRGEWQGFVTPPAVAEPGRLRAGMHMPRWASRITLEVTGVRVERLGSISDPDAIAEGIDVTDSDAPSVTFAKLWDSINAQRAPWQSNPWVWVVAFRLASS